jgi:hypothetical protein
VALQELCWGERELPAAAEKLLLAVRKVRSWALLPNPLLLHFVLDIFFSPERAGRVGDGNGGSRLGFISRRRGDAGVSPLLPPVDLVAPPLNGGGKEYLSWML